MEERTGWPRHAPNANVTEAGAVVGEDGDLPAWAGLGGSRALGAEA